MCTFPSINSINKPIYTSVQTIFIMDTLVSGTTYSEDCIPQNKVVFCNTVQIRETLARLFSILTLPLRQLVGEGLDKEQKNIKAKKNVLKGY